MLQRETVLRNHPKTQAVLDRLRVDASAASVAGAPVVVSCGGAAAEEGDDETVLDRILLRHVAHLLPLLLEVTSNSRISSTFPRLGWRF